MNTHDKYELPPLPLHPSVAHMGGRHMQADCQFPVLYAWAKSYALSAIEAACERIAELEAARFAYASEFPHDDNGDPDVGNIHANIRKLKADLEACRKRRGEPYAQLIVVDKDDTWPQLVYLKGVNLKPGTYDLFLSPQSTEPVKEPWGGHRFKKHSDGTWRCAAGCGPVLIEAPSPVKHWPDGTPRDERDISSDPEGTLVHDPSKPLYATPVATQSNKSSHRNEEVAAMEAVMQSVDPATWPGLTASQRCALGRFAKPSGADNSVPVAEVGELKHKDEPWGWTVLGVTYPRNWTYIGDRAERLAKREAKGLGDGYIAAPLFLGTAPQPVQSQSITPADAVYGLMAWLSGRNEVVTLSANHGASIAADLAKAFCEANGLQQFSEDYPNNLKYPQSSLSQAYHFQPSESTGDLPQVVLPPRPVPVYKMYDYPPNGQVSCDCYSGADLFAYGRECAEAQRVADSAAFAGDSAALAMQYKLAAQVAGASNGANGLEPSGQVPDYKAMWLREQRERIELQACLDLAMDNKLSRQAQQDVDAWEWADANLVRAEAISDAQWEVENLISETFRGYTLREAIDHARRAEGEKHDNHARRAQGEKHDNQD